MNEINRNKSLVQPYSELVEEAVVQFRNDVTLNFNDYEQQENEWGRDFVTNLSCKLFKVVDPFHIFLTGGGGVGKSHLLTTIHHCLTKLLMYKGGEPSKERILILAPTGVAAINVNGTTIHTGLKSPTRCKLFPLSDKAKTSSRL